MTPRGANLVKASFRIGVAWKSQVQPRDALQHRLGAVELAGRSFRAAAARGPTLGAISQVLLQLSGTATGRTPTDTRSISSNRYIYPEVKESWSSYLWGDITKLCIEIATCLCTGFLMPGTERQLSR